MSGAQKRKLKKQKEEILEKHPKLDGFVNFIRRVENAQNNQASTSCIQTTITRDINTIDSQNKNLSDEQNKDDTLLKTFDNNYSDGNNNKKIPKDTLPTISYLKLFRYISKCELFMIVIGILFTAIKALVMPILIIIYSEFTSMLVDRSYGIGVSAKTYLLPLMGGGKQLINATREENNAELYNDSIAFGILFFIFSFIFFIIGIFTVDIFNHIALKQISRMRINFFKSMIRQDIGWHDKQINQNFAIRITDEIEKIRDGTSEKITHFLYLFMNFIIMIIVSLFYGWKLTLAVSAYIPIVVITNIYSTKYQSKLTTREIEAYAKGGNLVEEVLSGIRTVVAFGGEIVESNKYENSLILARKAGQRRGIFTGISEGVVRGLLYITCAGAFWYGVNLILADREKEIKEYTPATMLIAFIGIILGADNVARSTPFVEAFVVAKGSAATIFNIIDTTSKIDPLSENGKKLPENLKADIEFQDVFFSYPSRDNVAVLRNLNFKIKNGTTVALVGSSGCGKSTCIQLIQRFYDPMFGKILMDNLDVKEYNISWLRSNIAVVGQEPVLFQGTIKDNISYGKENATTNEIEVAAKEAGIHNFILNLPQGYKTFIGEKGTQLSGGQKQRIAIARALIQNPTILLLDEATSALDYESEKLVQEALDIASKGRTTIVVSHRLSAIKGADKIIYIENGKVVEEGSHKELMELNGNYHKMVIAGTLQGADENTREITRKQSTEILKKSFSLDMNNLKGENFKKENLQLESQIFKEVKEINKDGNKKVTVQYFKTFVRILKIIKSEWLYMILGAICAGLIGASYPALTLCFAEFYASLAITDEDDVLRSVRLVSIICTIIGILIFFICFLQIFLFNICGIRLAVKLRLLTFKSIMQQNISWFDEETNNVGSLSARLAGDASTVQGATGNPLCGILQAISTFVISISIAFYYSWKLALLCSAMIPFIIGSVVLEAKFMSNTAIQEKEILEEASRLATEAITNVRTVTGLRRERVLIDIFTKEMYEVEKLLQKKLRFRGLVNSCGQSLMYFGYSVALTYGGILTSQGLLPFQDILKVSETLLYGSMMLGQSLSLTPAFAAAILAAYRLFELIDRKPTIFSPSPTDKNKAIMNQFNGVQYKNIQFSYPTRPEIPILHGLDLEILQGITVAFVGHSGCGKSTCIQLLQRFYDPDNGKIQISQGNIRTDMTLESLRSKLGIVSQEPVLFEGTIADNIAYGDNTREVSLAEVMEASQQANVHDFIISLPLGYDTRLGARGTQLSGGQKQRIAIARALVRNPKILLLDEATSALDLQSEKVVQAALDRACSGRTCIVIAHRLTTIQNADLICVFEAGKIVEQGNHQDLLSLKGIYYNLFVTQPQLH